MMSNFNNVITFLFTNILTISLQAVVVSLVVLFISKIFKKQLNPRLSYLLWVLVLIRLVIPVLPKSPISIFNAFSVKSSSVFQIVPSNTVSTNDTYNAPISALSSDLNTQDKSGSLANDKFNTDTMANTPNIIETSKQAGDSSDNLFTLLAYIWLIGAIIIIEYLIYVNITFSNRLKKYESISIPEEMISNIRKKTGIKRNICFVQSHNISSPSVYGILKSTILIPARLLNPIDEKTLYNILLHEFAHVKRNDLLISWLSYILCALHWFNPILWFSTFTMRRGQEVCADSYAMSLMDEEEIISYGKTLLEMAKMPAAHRTILCTAGINESKNEIKDRIKNIAVFSKKKYRISFVGIVLFALIGLFLCTSSAYIPKTPEEQMKFQNNIMLSVSSLQAKKSLQDINLEIHNKNNIGIWSCTLYLYDGPPQSTNRKLVHSYKSFRIGSGSVASFNIRGIDYNNTYFKLSYTVGFSLFEKSTKTVVGQLKAYDKTTDINNWGAVSDEEIFSFLKENDITSIGTTKIYDFYTVVLFEKGSTSTGYYEMWKDTKKNEVMSRLVQGSGDGKLPVSLFGGTASGNYPFANIVINDPTILELGDKMVIECTGRNINTNVSGKRGHTLETRGVGDILKVLIYDKSDNLIYDGENG